MTTEANKDLLIEFGLRIINAMDYTGKTVDSVVNAGNKAVGFVVDQLPDVIQQLILYKAVWHGFMALLFISMVVLSIVVWVKAFKKAKVNLSEGKYPHDEGFSGGMIFSMRVSFLAFVPSFFLSIYHIESFLVVTLAPKVWLLEYAAQLIKSN